VGFLTSKEQWAIFWILMLLLVGYGTKHYRLAHPQPTDQAHEAIR